MRCFSKLIFTIILALTSVLANPKSVSAASEFSASYENHYTISDSGLTLVKHDIVLTNNISNVYADEYTLSIGLTDISKLEIRDKQGLITHRVAKTDNQATISFNFPDKVVGKNNSNHFTITYQTKDIAVRQGTIWEINIPKLDSEELVTKQQTTLRIPVAFGTPSYTTPHYKYLTQEDQYLQLFFDLSTSSQNISAIFGTTQYIDFEIKYFLDNPKPETQTFAVAIPPDTNYQNMYYHSIDPSPENVTVDVDGNWIAQFVMPPNQQQTIFTKGIARINFLPALSPLSPEDYQRYLGDSQHWQVTDTSITALAAKLGTPKSIYQYLVEHLSYDYSKVYLSSSRLGALATLSDPTKAICTEFTDLFVALARASGVPAREHNGYAFTQNSLLRPLSLTQDILHAWPDFYDTSTDRWYQVDPTWGKTTGGVDYFTKLDLNHFTFVIHGDSSTKPLPAGSYRPKNSTDKMLLLNPASPSEFPPPSVTLTHTQKPASVDLIFKNTSGVAFSAPLSISLSGKNQSLPSLHIPPFGQHLVNIPLPGFRFIPSSLKLDVNYGDHTASLAITAGSTLTREIVLAAILAAGLILVCLTFVAWRLYLRRRTPRPPLYW